MYLQGGLTRKHDMRGFYVKLLDMIDTKTYIGSYFGKIIRNTGEDQGKPRCIRD